MIAHPSPSFYRESNVLKFGLILVFDALYYRNEAMNRKCENSFASAYDWPASIPNLMKVVPLTLRSHVYMIAAVPLKNGANG